MVGMLMWLGGMFFVLVKILDMGLYRVKEGNYVGCNFGKIIVVNLNKIDLIEIVFDG